jgi:hypothetical protein
MHYEVWQLTKRYSLQSTRSVGAKKTTKFVATYRK